MPRWWKSLRRQSRLHTEKEPRRAWLSGGRQRDIASCDREHRAPVFDTLEQRTLLSATLNSGLVGQWNVDEYGGSEAFDSVSVNDLTLSGDAEFQTDAGYDGGALSFDGSGKAEAGDVHDAFSGDFSVSLWFKRPTGGALSGGDQVLISKGNRFSTREGWSVVISDTTQEIRFRVNSSDSSAERASTEVDLPQDDEWHHLLLVVDRAEGRVIGYLDGSNDGWRSGGGGPSSSSLTNVTDIDTDDPFTVGAVRDGSNSYNNFEGLIDDVRVYDRALVSGEANAFINPPELDSGLVAHYRANETSGDTSSDSQGSNDLQLVNGTTFDVAGGYSGGALSFDGSNDRAEAGDVLDPFSGSYSVSLWFKRPSGGAIGSDQVLISKGNRYSTREGWSVVASDATQEIRFRVNSSDSTAERASTEVDLPQDDEWHHLAVIVDRATGRATGYLDGSNDGWRSGGGGPSSSSLTNVTDIDTDDPFTIGAVRDGANSYYNYEGLIDEVRVYDRALTSAEAFVLSSDSGQVQFTFGSSDYRALVAANASTSVDPGATGLDTSHLPIVSDNKNFSVVRLTRGRSLVLPDTEVRDSRGSIAFKVQTAYTGSNPLPTVSIATPSDIGGASAIQMNLAFENGDLVLYQQGSAASVLSTGQNWADETWHQVALSWDQSAVTLWVDGVARATGTISTETLDALAGASVVLGDGVSALSAGDVQVIDDVQAFSRVYDQDMADEAMASMVTTPGQVSSQVYYGFKEEPNGVFGTRSYLEYSTSTAGYESYASVGEGWLTIEGDYVPDVLGSSGDVYEVRLSYQAAINSITRYINIYSQNATSSSDARKTNRVSDGWLTSPTSMAIDFSQPAEAIRWGGLTVPRGTFTSITSIGYYAPTGFSFGSSTSTAVGSYSDVGNAWTDGRGQFKSDVLGSAAPLYWGAVDLNSGGNISTNAYSYDSNGYNDAYTSIGDGWLNTPNKVVTEGVIGDWTNPANLTDVEFGYYDNTPGGGGVSVRFPAYWDSFSEPSSYEGKIIPLGQGVVWGQSQFSSIPDAANPQEVWLGAIDLHGSSGPVSGAQVLGLAYSSNVFSNASTSPTPISLGLGWIADATLSGTTLDDEFIPADVNHSKYVDPNSDADEDGYTYLQERLWYRTNPDSSDTDQDGLSDDWEIKYRPQLYNTSLSPSVRQALQASDGEMYSPLLKDPATQDADDDGLPDYLEAAYDSDPTKADSDGDGVSDGQEHKQGSNLKDGSDGGLPPEPGTRERFQITVGDWSISNSEQWSLKVGDITLNAPGFGEVVTENFWFNVGGSYDVKIKHIDSKLDPGSEDYDWVAGIGLAPAEDGVATSDPRADYFLVDDKNIGDQSLFTVGGNFNISGATGKLVLPVLDIDLQGLSDADEANPANAKFLNAANGDADSDGIPDWADLVSPNSSARIPVTLELAENIREAWESGTADLSQIQITFSYTGANQAEIDQLFSLSDPAAFAALSTSPGVRLWRNNGSSSSDYLAPGTSYSASDLGLTPGSPLPLLLDAQPGFVGANGVTPITVTATISSDWFSGPLGDTTHAGVINIDLDIDSDNSGLYEAPERSDVEDQIEELSNGVKLLVVNRDDLDRDEIPDFADFNGQTETDGGVNNPTMRFVPIVVAIPDLTQVELSGATIRFDYSASDPTAINIQSHDSEGLGGTKTAYSYSAAPGSIRLWDIDASQSRSTTSILSGGNFVQAGQELTLESLGLGGEVRSKTLYVEAVNGSSTVIPIDVILTLSGQSPLADRVNVLPVSPETGVDSSIGFDDIEGVQIHRGDGSSIIGHDGTDLIFGTSGDDDNIDGRGGDDIIFTGGGNDQVFLDSDGGTDLVINLSGDLVVEGNPGNVLGYWFNEYTLPDNQRLNYDTADVKEAYDQLFGLDNPYWQSFEVTGDGFFSVSAEVDENWLLQLFQNDLGEITSVSNKNGDYSVILSSRIANPYVSAQLLHERVKRIVRSDTDLIDAYNARTVLNDPSWKKNSDGDYIYDLLDDRAGDFFTTAANTADLYLQGLGIVSVGAEIALAIDDTARAFKEGGVQAGVATATFNAFFIAIPATPAGSYVMKKGDNVLGKVFQKADGFIADISTVLKQGAAAADDIFADVAAKTGDDAIAFRVRDSFTPGTIKKITVDEDLIAYKYSADGQSGSFYLTTQVLSPEEARKQLALPNSNTAAKVEIVRLKQGETVYVGEVADQSGNLADFGPYAEGGGLQIYITDQSSVEILVSGPN